MMISELPIGHVEERRHLHMQAPVTADAQRGMLGAAPLRLRVSVRGEKRPFV